MGLRDLFSTDRDLEKTGIILDFGDCTITIARAGGSNKSYDTAIKNKMLPIQRQVQKGLISDKKLNEMMLSVYADTIILDWKNVKGKDGKILEFNKSNVISVMEEMPDLFQYIIEESNNLATFQSNDIEEVVELVKND